MQVDAEDRVEIDILEPASEHDGGQHWAPVSLLACNRLDKSSEHGSRLSIELRWHAVSVRADMATLVWRPRGTGATAAPACDAAASGAESSGHAHDATGAHDPSPSPAERRRAVLHSAAPRSEAAAAAAAPVQHMATAVVAGPHPKQEPGTAGHDSAQPLHQVQHCTPAAELMCQQPSARASTAVAHACAAPGKSQTALPHPSTQLIPNMVDLTDDVPIAAAGVGTAAAGGSAPGQQQKAPPHAQEQAPQSSKPAAVQPCFAFKGAACARTRSTAGASQAEPAAEQAQHGALTQPQAAQPPSYTQAGASAVAAAAGARIGAQASNSLHESARAALPSGNASGERAAVAPCTCCLDRARGLNNTRCRECKQLLRKVNDAVPHATLSREALYSAVRYRRSTNSGFFASEGWTALDAASAAELLCASPCQPEGSELHQQLQAALRRLSVQQGDQHVQHQPAQRKHANKSSAKCRCCLTVAPGKHHMFCKACSNVFGRIRRVVDQVPGCSFRISMAFDAVHAKLLADADFFQSAEWLQTQPKQAVLALVGADCFEPEVLFCAGLPAPPASATAAPAAVTTVAQPRAARNGPRHERDTPAPEPAAAECRLTEAPAEHSGHVVSALQSDSPHATGNLTGGALAVSASKTTSGGRASLSAAAEDAIRAQSGAIASLEAALAGRSLRTGMSALQPRGRCAVALPSTFPAFTDDCELMQLM